MIKEELLKNDNLKTLFLNFAKSEGLDKEQTKKILNANYTKLSSNTKKISGLNEILQELSDGHSVSELKNFFSKETIKNFNDMLKINDLTVDNAVALKKYCEDSKIILKCSRNLSLDNEHSLIINNSTKHLKENGFSNEDIKLCMDYVLNLDYSLPLYKNYELTKNNFTQTYNKAKVRSINTIIQNFNSFNNIEKIKNDLKSALSKPLQQDVVLFRAIKSGFFLEKFGISPDNIEQLQGKVLEDVGFTSTSTDYATSFAKYKNYDTILEILAPKGTQGLLVSDFSDYGDVENEFLLNSNKMFIYYVKPNVIDENNNKKVLLKCVAVSQDKCFYKSKEKGNTQKAGSGRVQ